MSFLVCLSCAVIQLIVAVILLMETFMMTKKWQLTCDILCRWTCKESKVNVDLYSASS